MSFVRFTSAAEDHWGEGRIPLLLTLLVLWVKWLLCSGGLRRFPTTLFRIQPAPLEHSGAFSLVILRSPYTKHELSIPCSGWLLPHEVKVIRDSSVFVSSLYKIPLLLLAVGHFLFFYPFMIWSQQIKGTTVLFTQPWLLWVIIDPFLCPR